MNDRQPQCLLFYEFYCTARRALEKCKSKTAVREDFSCSVSKPEKEKNTSTSFIYCRSSTVLLVLSNEKAILDIRKQKDCQKLN
ncbi:hypothetical protein chiPu_0002580 [Chiloscyllium punctatum]|uniref:Uncharacterized protein n=1 Tax=Chiloscyllium punctatum TaxID=137246 RepID=A0A401S1F4_CHIPU|nr:hypothetical protein [Chiloscyllium punctatum]